MKRKILDHFILPFLAIVLWSVPAMAAEEDMSFEALKARAEQGDAHSQVKLGQLYFLEDDAEALRLFRLAAEQGYGMGSFWVGEMYLTSRAGGEYSMADVHAYVWWSIAAALGYEKGREKSELWADFNLSSSELATAQEIAARCIDSGYKDCE